MGFMFRVEQIVVTEDNTVLSGHMISGALNWHQRVELQVVERGQIVGPTRAEERNAVPGVNVSIANNMITRFEGQLLGLGEQGHRAHGENAPGSPVNPNDEPDRGRGFTSVAAEQGVSRDGTRSAPSDRAGGLEIGRDMNSVFSAPLCGVVSAEDTGLTMFDPALWEKVLSLPMWISREKRIGLILDGIAPSGKLPVPAIAAGRDAPVPAGADGVETAFQSVEVPSWSGADFGRPIHQYPYQMSRQGMLFFAPWGLFCITVVLALILVALAFNGVPLHRVSSGRMLACAMLGLFDVIFIYLSIRMMLARPSSVVVTTCGIVIPVMLPGFSSDNVYVSFHDMVDMLEYRRNDTVLMLKLKTVRGILHLNLFMMQASHFEAVRRLLRRRIQENRIRSKGRACAAT